eukprot:SAG11_NODE_2098_length_3827_cov_2.481223_6_plen_56_part_00
MKFVKRAGSNYILEHIFWNMTTARMARYRVFPKQYIRTVVDNKNHNSLIRNGTID